jgi:hypothetical protein
MEVGKIKVVNPEQVVNWKVQEREVVDLTDEQYPQRSIAIEFAQDKCDVYLIYIKKVIALKFL